jgi:hypothetical protein
MKTAMQELIEMFEGDFNIVESKRKDTDSVMLIEKASNLSIVIWHLKRKLEKEKEQIIEAHFAGWSDAYDYLESDSNDRARQSEEYYEETYEN